MIRCIREDYQSDYTIRIANVEILHKQITKVDEIFETGLMSVDASGNSRTLQATKSLITSGSSVKCYEIRATKKVGLEGCFQCG